MAGGWLDHKILQIIKGVGKTPTDTYSAEADPVVVNLLSGAITLEANGWSPNIPAIKNSGVWSDSPIADGRTLLAAPVGNVVEKMSVIISDKSYLGMQRQLSNLNLIVSYCRNFWQSYDQIDPVYLAWWAGCGVGPQYALLYNIELAPEYLDGPVPSIRVSMTLEREPYWRGLPPGANPKLWTHYVYNRQPTISNMHLDQGTDHLIYKTISNKFEWTPAGDGLQVTPISVNYVDIPDTLVPGDAPALLEYSISAGVLNKAFAGLSARKITGTNHLNVLKANSYILNAGDGTVLNGAVKNNTGSASSGVLSNNSAVTYYNVSKALALGDTTYSPYISWGADASGALAANILELDRHLMAGKFAVFLRARGTTEDTTQKARITFSELETNNINLNRQDYQLVDIPITVNASGGYNIIYCGVVSLPLAQREAVSLSGYGTFIRETAGQFYVTLELKNSSGAARTVTILDLILMPIDQFMNEIITGVKSSAGSTITTVDSTGYLMHGDTTPISVLSGATSPSAGLYNELLGQDPFLLPRTNQKLYFLISSNFAEQSFPSTSIDVRINIVPRWSGIRDV